MEINTYNFGSVDSVGVVIFCAGSRRFSVPHARFLLHGVRVGFQGNINLDEKQLEESLKGLRIDQFNVAKVIADTVNQTTAAIEVSLNERTTLNPEEALKFGLVHEIKSELFPLDADLSVIEESQAGQHQVSLPIGIPQVRGFTESIDANFTTLP